MNLQELQKEIQIIEDKKKQINENFEKILINLLREALSPDVTGFRWIQELPTWNDGSPCVFSITTLEILSHEKFATKYECYPVEDSWYELNLLYPNEGLPEPLKKIINLFESLDPRYFEDCFGTNVKVTFIDNHLSIEDWNVY